MSKNKQNVKNTKILRTYHISIFHEVGLIWHGFNLHLVKFLLLLIKSTFTTTLHATFAFGGMADAICKVNNVTDKDPNGKTNPGINVKLEH